MKTPTLAVAMAILCLSTTSVWAQEGSHEGIGLFTSVQGTVTVTHPHLANTLPVNLHDEVLFKDVIETRTESRTKAFFDDDSILTVGEQSHVEITEHIYDPDRNLRRMVVKLVQGRLRALVAKVFNGPGSAFEIHTPTAVAAARGTYFVVWVENGVTGIVNIGHSGGVDFTSEGKTVRVNPGQYSVAPAGVPPAQPLVYDAGPGSNGVARAEKTTIAQAVVKGNIVETAHKTTGTVAKVVTTGGAETVETVGKDVARAGETIEKTLGKTTETVGKTLGKVDNLLGQQAGLLASARNAIEGTVLMDVPLLEMAIDIVRMSHIPVLATPVLSPTSAVTANNTTSSPNGTTVPLVTSATQGTPLAPATLVGAMTPLAPTTVAPVTSALASVTSIVAPVLAPVTSILAPALAPVTPIVAPVLAPVTSIVAPVLAPVTPILAPVTPPAIISGAVNILGK